MSHYQNHWTHTLCWDCANACGGCSWSESLVPVKGWKATPTTNASYLVQGCPEFVRDAYESGAKRIKKGGLKNAGQGSNDP